MDSRDDQPNLRLRIRFGADEVLGPGKAELLERIDSTGSIAAAAREMDMSYKRAWLLIEALNAMFGAPAIETTRGGKGKGGAVLTGHGRAILADYRTIEAAARDHGAAELARLQSLLRRGPKGSGSAEG